MNWSTPGKPTPPKLAASSRSTKRSGQSARGSCVPPLRGPAGRKRRDPLSQGWHPSPHLSARCVGLPAPARCRAAGHSWITGIRALDRREGEPTRQPPVLRELRVGTGRQNGGARRLDAFALNTLPHTAMKPVCYEVKTSRGDFLSEIKRPLKRRIGMRYSIEFYFVTPAALVAVAEIPPECGLVEAGHATFVDWKDLTRISHKEGGGRPNPVANIFATTCLGQKGSRLPL